MQRKKEEWNREGFGVDEARMSGDNDGEERDRYYQEYDVEVDTRKDMDEASDEDVRPTSPPR